MTANSDVSTRRRVKLYMLNDERQWDDKGTGHVSATFVDQNAMALVVISETDGSHLLESKIQHDTAYQKQQETLIVWSEGDNMDLALSFQEKTGCDDIWEKICNVQGKDPSVEITQDLIDDADDTEDMEMDTTTPGSTQGFEFPPCDLSHLAEISEMFTQVVNYPIQRERLASALERTQYLKQLTDLFHKAEDLEDIKSLHYLYEIVRAIIQFNRRNLFEIIFADEFLMDIIGMLEYTPSKRVKHREFLQKKANFKEVLPMNASLKAKIHQTFRVQYIQDSCMPPPSLFDDNGGASLNSFVYLNKIDIITKLQDDTNFMSHLFNGLLSADLVIDHRSDLLLLLKDFCLIVNSLQPAQKESFFATLAQNRALKALFFSMKLVDENIRSICVDILQIFVENQASAVREFFVNDSRESNASTNSLHINTLIDQLINDRDPELSNGFIIMSMLKVLLDPENMINSPQRNEKQEFLNFLYKHSMQHLTRPLMDLTEGGELQCHDYHSAMVLHDIVELLAFCVEFHSYHMKNYFFHNNTISRIVVLFKSRHSMLVLAALRVVRKFVASREEFNYRYMIKNDILANVVSLLDRNPQYNMLNSAILELFEFIRNENIACLITNVIENHWSVLQRHEYTNIFQLLKTRYDQSVERSIKAGGSASAAVNMLSLMGASVGGTRVRRGAIATEDDEEQWYDQEEEEEENSNGVGGSSGNEASQSPMFVERYSRKCETSESVPDFKSQSGRYSHIAINIKTTSLGVSVPSSSSSITQSDSASTESATVTSSLPSILTNGDTQSDRSHINQTPSADSSKVNETLLTGLVDYTSDDDDDDDDDTSNEVVATGDSGVTEDVSGEVGTSGAVASADKKLSRATSPKRLKTE